MKFLLKKKLFSQQRTKKKKRIYISYKLMNIICKTRKRNKNEEKEEEASQISIHFSFIIVNKIIKERCCCWHCDYYSASEAAIINIINNKNE